MTAPNPELAGHSTLPEPELLFHGNQREKHPLLGLIKHGPYGLRFGMPNSLRLALVARNNDFAPLRKLITELDRNARPVEATNYYPDYPGFSGLFRIPVASPTDRTTIALPSTLDSHASAGARHKLAEELFQSLARLRTVRSEFDVALVYLPADWANCFEGEDFDFHDYLILQGFLRFKAIHHGWKLGRLV